MSEDDAASKHPSSGPFSGARTEAFPTPALGIDDFTAPSAVPEQGEDAALSFVLGERNSRSMPRFQIEYEPGDNQPKIELRRVADALRIAVGNISSAARVLSEASNSRVSRAYVQKRIQAEPLLAELMEELHETVLDEAEDNIRMKVSLGDAEASKFLLKTIGRKRGYVEPKISDTDAIARDATAQEKLNALEEGKARARNARARSDAINDKKVIDITPKIGAKNG